MDTDSTTNVIQFRLPRHLKGFIAEPYRAATVLPKWFKELVPDVETNRNEFPTHTAKRCSPMLDSLSAGYIIPFPVAVNVIADEEYKVTFNWRTQKFEAVNSHSNEQVGNLKTNGVFKWINPWSIVTPPGYSCLFITPVNRPELPFECFTGIVDTDTYHNPVNFPFHWTEYPWEGVIDRGDPMMQVIPFKREEWSHEVVHLDEEESLDLENMGTLVSADQHHYTKTHHNRKRW